MLTRTMILALSLTIGSLPAVAAESAAATVRVDDLDLTRATDRERLDVRLRMPRAVFATRVFAA